MKHAAKRSHRGALSGKQILADLDVGIDIRILFHANPTTRVFIMYVTRYKYKMDKPTGTHYKQFTHSRFTRGTGGQCYVSNTCHR